MTIKQIDFTLTLPDKEPYEGKATQKQKQKIWTLGYHDTSVIDGLGKKQASAVIDQLLAIYGYEFKKHKAKRSFIAGLIFLVIGATSPLFVKDSALLGCLLIGGVLLGIVLSTAGGLSLLVYLITKPKSLRT